MAGKDKCEFLKGIRKRMAEANGIPYEPRECTYEGECTGTCPFCEKEAAELMEKLKEKEAKGAIIETDHIGIDAIQSMRIKSMDEGDNLKGSLMNATNEDTGHSTTPSDPFRGANNPLMSRKELSEIEHIIHEQEEPLMGDIRFPYSNLSDAEEEMRVLLQEEEEREQKRKKMGIIRKILASFKRTGLQGLIDEE